MRALRLTLTALAVGAAFMQPARAGLFEDDEARKAILELRNKVQANEDAAKQRADQLNALIQEQLQPLRRSLLDLNGQNRTITTSGQSPVDLIISSQIQNAMSGAAVAGIGMSTTP